VTRSFNFRSGRLLTGQPVQLSKERSLEGSTVSTRGGIKNERRRRIRKDRSARTGNVLVPVQGCDNGGTVSELLAVLGVGREETLKQSGGGIEDGGTLATRLHSDVNLLEVNELGGDLGDLGVTATGEVGIAEESSQFVGLMLNEHVREG